MHPAAIPAPFRITVAAPPGGAHAADPARTRSARGIGNTTITLFDVGSVAKQYTTAAILRLSDREVFLARFKDCDAVLPDGRFGWYIGLRESTIFPVCNCEEEGEMSTGEIKWKDLDPKKFIKAQVKAITRAVGDGTAINALSGGVDSAAVTMLGHRALGERLKTCFIENGLMREGEPRRVVKIFEKLGVHVELIDAREQFFGALAGLTDPEEKRNAITKTFYETVFGPLVKDSGAKYLFHGTNLTDVEETVAGIKRQHNILAQIGIDPEETYGYRVLEPLLQLRKRGVREVAKALDLPKKIHARPPFPGPALATRIVGEVTPERVATVRAATAIVEEELLPAGAFQCLAILHEDRVTGMRDGKREFGQQIEVRCWDSKDAVTGKPTKLPFKTLRRLGRRLTEEVPGVVSATYNITEKPPSTIEAV